MQTTLPTADHAREDLCFLTPLPLKFFILLLPKSCHFRKERMTDWAGCGSPAPSANRRPADRAWLAPGARGCGDLSLLFFLVRNLDAACSEAQLRGDRPPRSGTHRGGRFAGHGAPCPRQTSPAGVGAACCLSGIGNLSCFRVFADVRICSFHREECGIRTRRGQDAPVQRSAFRKSKKNASAPMAAARLSAASAQFGAEATSRLRKEPERGPHVLAPAPGRRVPGCEMEWWMRALCPPRRTRWWP